ncbi:hypothetical protein GLYMA_04G125350v4 [Glycine max]|nr:hypothetical protein GLYMA_04G125350v4 [Glycine max]KAH1111093.1 hypothetical protein GYH30_009739 [Glycine max]
MTGEMFFLTTGNGTMEVLSYPSLRPLDTLMAHTAGCYCIAIDPIFCCWKCLFPCKSVGHLRNALHAYLHKAGFLNWMQNKLGGKQDNRKPNAHKTTTTTTTCCGSFSKSL